MPGLLKIGQTSRDPFSRKSELHTTGVPSEFELLAAIKVIDAITCEKAVFEALNNRRVSNNREFFKGSTTELFSVSLPIISEFLAHEKVKIQEEDKPDYFEVIFLEHFVEGGSESHSVDALVDALDHYNGVDIHKSFVVLEALVKKEFITEHINNRTGEQVWRLTMKGRRHAFEHSDALKEIYGDPFS